MKAKYFILPLFLTIFVSCESEEANILEDQKTNIVNYLQKEGREYTLIDGVYKSFRTTPVTPVPPEPGPDPEPEPDPDPEPEPELEQRIRVAGIVLQNGDSITINYVAQLFNTGPAGVYDTNIFAIAKEVGLDTLSDNLVPMKIKYGTTTLITGLRSGLQNSKEGDSFSLFMPYTIGYGEKENGVVPAKSALNFEIDVLEIKR